jgi:translation elongation factor EF-Tu-like GTPase
VLVLEAFVEFTLTIYGGRRYPVMSGYKPQFYFNEQYYDCVVNFPDSTVVFQGDHVWAVIALSPLASDLLYCRLGPGEEFELREGKRVVARGTVKLNPTTQKP